MAERTVPAIAIPAPRCPFFLIWTSATMPRISPSGGRQQTIPATREATEKPFMGGADGGGARYPGAPGPPGYPGYAW